MDAPTFETPMLRFVPALLLASSATFALTAPPSANKPAAPKVATRHGPAGKCLFKVPEKVARYTRPATPAEEAASGFLTGDRAGLKPVGGGGVCSGQIFKVTRPGLKIWRIASSSASSPMGSWWSFDKSDDKYTTRAKWRKDNCVCRDWNPDADRIIACTPAVGDLIMIGPGQSAHCDDVNVNNARLDVTRYPESRTLQIDWTAHYRRKPLDQKGCSTPLPVRWTDVEGPGVLGAKPAATPKRSARTPARN